MNPTVPEDLMAEWHRVLYLEYKMGDHEVDTCFGHMFLSEYREQLYTKHDLYCVRRNGRSIDTVTMGIVRIPMGW